MNNTRLTARSEFVVADRIVVKSALTILQYVSFGVWNSHEDLRKDI